MKREFRLEYTNNVTREVRSRIIKAENREDAVLWFENHLELNNLLDAVEEV